MRTEGSAQSCASTVVIHLWGSDYSSDCGYVAPEEGEITHTIKADLKVKLILKLKDMFCDLKHMHHMSFVTLDNLPIFTLIICK